MRRVSPSIILLLTLISVVSIGLAQTETEYGNNLAVPVVFAEGYGLTGSPTGPDTTGLRGAAGTPNLLGTATTCSSISPCYLQQSVSDWQAEWANGAPETVDGFANRIPGESVIVNWSDNLISQRWTPHSPVRVEVVLYQTSPGPTFSSPMLAYNMYYYAGTGANEMWGSDGSTYLSSYRTVFSVNAHLKIEKLQADNRTVDPVVTAACGFDGTIWKSFGLDGPGGYAAEVNVSGNLIYGYNWMINKCDGSTASKMGRWRLTFMLDPEATLPEASTPVKPNVLLGALDPLDITADSERHYATPVLVSGSETKLEIDIVAAKGGGSSRRPN